MVERFVDSFDYQNSIFLNLNIHCLREYFNSKKPYTLFIFDFCLNLVFHFENYLPLFYVNTTHAYCNENVYCLFGYYLSVLLRLPLTQLGNILLNGLHVT